MRDVAWRVFIYQTLKNVYIFITQRICNVYDISLLIRAAYRVAELFR